MGRVYRQVPGHDRLSENNDRTLNDIYELLAIDSFANFLSSLTLSVSITHCTNAVANRVEGSSVEWSGME